MSPLPFLSLLLSAAVFSAGAQTVWRCGPDGRSYSDAPCRDGQVVAVADTRSADVVSQARLVAEGQQRLALQMAADRRERERELAARGSGLSAIEPVRPAPGLKSRAARPAESKRPNLKLRTGSAGRTSQPTRRATLGKMD
jgi:hypothetical protein